MSNPITPAVHLKLFLSSPGDVQVEREVVKRVVEELSQTPPWNYWCAIDLLAWERKVPPDAGKPPQMIIDEHMRQAGEADIFVCVLCHRIGTPVVDTRTGHEYPSGTIYEFYSAYSNKLKRARPVIMLYYGQKQIPDVPSVEELTQLIKVREFFKRFEGPAPEFMAFIQPYKSIEEFETKFRQQLQQHLDKLLTPTQDLTTHTSTSNAPDSILRGYLSWLVEQNRWLQLQGIREAGTLRKIELEHVYIALKAEPDSSYERRQAKVVHELDARELAGVEDLNQLGPEVLRFVDAQVIRRTYRPEFERKRREQVTQIQSVADAFRRHRWLVILGGPGSGKSTMARWLTLQFARVMLQGSQAGEEDSQRLIVRVPATQVDMDSEEMGSEVDLGPARLPILIRVADYAREYAKVLSSKKQVLPLAEYLGQQPLGKEVPTYNGQPISPKELNELFRTHLSRGQGIVVLDGLDELTEHNRRAIVEQIEIFIRVWVNGKGIGTGLTNEQVPLGEPWEHGGNQILVTSRFVGYGLDPIKSGAAHFAVQPMSRRAVERFCRTWTVAVNATDGEDEDFVALDSMVHREADDLIRTIYDDTRPTLRELATNPLLVTILASVYRFNDGQLPDQRAELYDRAIDNLLRMWLEREECQAAGLQIDELLVALEPLAAYMHENATANGLIHIDQIAELVTLPLAQWRQMQPSDPHFMKLRRTFLTTLGDQVGLLAEQSDGNYSFLHRTFQEFLAARHLLRIQSQAASEIVARFDDPLWREPILLALGYATVSSEWGPQARAALLRAVIDGDDPLQTIMPRTALLLCSALPEMRKVPEEIVEEITQSLLIACAKWHGEPSYAPLLKQVEQAFDRLRGGIHADTVAWVFREALLSRRHDLETLPLVTAKIMRTIDWFTTETVEALLQATARDRRAWGWPIDGALRAALCLRPAEATWLRPGPRLNRPRVLSFLPLRRALEQAPKLVEIVRGDLDWLCLITALYGGYGDSRFTEWLEQQQQENVKENLDEQVSMPLDQTIRGGLKALEARPPTFDPTNIYRDSFDPNLTYNILKLLRAHRPASDLIPYLQTQLQASTELAAQAEAAVALTILTGASRGGSLSKEVRRLASDPFQRMQETLREPIIRIGRAGLKALGESNISDEDKAILCRELIELNAANGGPPLQVSEIIPELRYIRIDTPGFDTYLNAEWLAYHLTGAIESGVYRAAVVIDTYGKKMVEPLERIVESFARVYESRNRFVHHRIELLLAPLLPQPKNFPEYYLKFLDVLAAIPVRLEFFGAFVLGACKPFLDQHPELLPETLALISARKDFFSYESEALLRENETYLLWSHEALLQRINQITDPYLRFRAIWRVMEKSVLNHQSNSLALLRRTAESIDEPHHKTLALETLLPYMGDYATALAEATTVAHGIAAPADRARAYARLALLAPVIESRHLFSRAINVASQIEDATERAEFLSELRPYILSDGTLRDEFRAAAGTLASPSLHAKVMGRPSQILRFNWGELRDNAVIWAPLYLGFQAAALQSEAVFEEGTDAQAASLTADSATSADQSSEAAVPLTYQRVIDFDAAFSRGETEGFLGNAFRLENPPPLAINIVERWRAQGPTIVQPYAALILIECGRISVENLRPLFDLLQTSDDRIRYRTMLALHGRQATSGNQNRRFTPYRLGPEVIELLAQETHRRQESSPQQDISPQVVTTLSWINHDIAHDDVPALDRWVAAAADSGDDSEPARLLLSNIEFASPDVIQRIVQVLPAAAPPVQKALLKSISRLASVRNNSSLNDETPELLSAIRQLSPEVRNSFKELPEGPKQVLEVAYLFGQEGGTIADRISAANAELEARRKWIDDEALISVNTLMAGLKTLGSEQYRSVDYINVWIKAAQEMAEVELTFKFLFDWTLDTLSPGADERVVSDFLPALAIMAKVSPMTFTAQANPDELEPLLVDIVERNLSWSSRQAAMFLLGHLRRVSKSVTRALKLAMQDVYVVQEAALTAVNQFRQLDGDILSELFDGLKSESATYAQATIQLLMALSQAEATSAADRRRILATLAAMAGKAEARRPVYALIGKSKLRIEFVERLDQAAYRAIFFISRL